MVDEAEAGPANRTAGDAGVRADDSAGDSAGDHAAGRVADRLALRALVDAYASGVDRRDVAGVTKLFAPDGRLVAHFYRQPGGSPTVRHGHAEIEAAIDEGLRQYAATTHVVGGQTLDFDTRDTARGETTCLAHHVYERAGAPRLLVLAVRYGDTFVRQDGQWRFAQRELRLDWRDDRPLEER